MTILNIQDTVKNYTIEEIRNDLNSDDYELVLEYKDRIIKYMLRKAAAAGRTDILELLVKEFNADVNYQESSNYTALGSAISSNNIESVKTLISLGANVNLLTVHNNSLLYLNFLKIGSLTKEQVDATLIITKLLVENGANINSLNQYLESPLNRAVRSRDNINSVQYLLEKGANASIRNKEEKSPMYNALLSSSYDIAKLLIIYINDSKSEIVDFENKSYLSDKRFKELMDVCEKKHIAEQVITLTMSSDHSKGEIDYNQTDPNLIANADAAAIEKVFKHSDILGHIVKHLGEGKFNDEAARDITKQALRYRKNQTPKQIAELGPKKTIAQILVKSENLNPIIEGTLNR